MTKLSVEHAAADGAAPSGTSTWRPQGLDTVPAAAVIPLITADDARPIIPGIDLWDSWPLQHEDGSTAVLGGQAWWFFLSAEQFPDPGQRHNAARIRLASIGAEGWKDHGCVIDPELSPGSREWAGSAVLSGDGRTVSLYFTAAGQRAEAHSFEQRLFVVDGSIMNGKPGDWGTPRELFAADGQRYVVAREAEGRPGMIKAFRDPAWFRDPATGHCHILFTASAGWTDCDYNGLVGIAVLVDGTWQLGDPLVEAVGVNNELERPHIVVRDGRYYLFWSTQRRTFDPAVASGPNGLYAMVADNLEGPWRPVNGNGLVAANPSTEPTQGYSWWVKGEGEVWSFIDHWGMAGRNFADHPELLRSQFGGTPAPCFTLEFAGNAIHILR
jgi:levansucrase